MKKPDLMEQSEKKDRLKAKIKAKVKARVQKRLDRFEDQFKIVVELLFKLRQDIESVNPRMSPMQPHTKDRWVNELTQIAELLSSLLPKKD